jgi:YfiH family protein
MIFVRNGSLPFFQFESFLTCDFVDHVVFTRQGGVSEGAFSSLNLSTAVADERTAIAENRRRAYGSTGRSTQTLVHAHLTHGNDVLEVGARHYGTTPGMADGLITAEPGCGITMNYADCAPIFLVDPINRAIGVGHAGWQGTVQDVPGAMVQAMARAYGSRPADLLAGIGPCIGPDYYEVDEPVISAVQAGFADPAELLRPQPGKSRPHFDIPLANQRNLERAGVRQIEHAGLCTASRTDLFFSHRAEKGRTGRFGVLLQLR